MPNFSEGNYRMAGQIRGLSVGARIFRMKIIAPPSASSWDVRNWRSRPRLQFVVADYSALLRNVSAFKTAHGKIRS